MTWYYNISDDASGMDIFDHTGTIVKTQENDGSGFTIPSDIQRAMREEADKARSNDNMERWRDIHIRLADNDIKEGAP